MDSDDASRTARRYHHGRLREAAIEAAVAEVRAVGAAGVSMREIARRAGVSHAALAYQFGDKAGIFTAIATEGFRLAVEAIGPAATVPDGFLLGGLAYIRFALTHPGHYEVMFRPDLYLRDDPDLVTARDAAFDLLYGSARASLATHPDSDEPADADVAGLVAAGWSLSHGFATLWLTTNLQEKVGPDMTAVTGRVAHSLVTLGELAHRYLTAAAEDTKHADDASG